MNFSRPGAIDLSALAKSSSPAPTGAAGGSWVVDVTEADFQSVALEASMRHLVVLSLWSPRAPQSADFNAVLAEVTNSYGGQILLAQVDVDTQGAIAQALGAQSVPLVVGLVGGQPVPLLQSTADAAQIRTIFDQLVQLGVQHGVTGRAAAVTKADADGQEPEEVDDPRFAAADAAFAAGDLPAAVAEYERLALQFPADAEITERLAGTRLMVRTSGADLNQTRAAAADAPDDVEAQLLVADLDVTGGHVDDAFDRLLQLLRRAAGDDVETIRTRLLELFTVVGVADPRVVAARRALATALY